MSRMSQISVYILIHVFDGYNELEHNISKEAKLSLERNVGTCCSVFDYH
jgi:hypothetical protein